MKSGGCHFNFSFFLDLILHVNLIFFRGGEILLLSGQFTCKVRLFWRV